MEPGVWHAPFPELFCPRQPVWDRNSLQHLNNALAPTSHARLTQRAWTTDRPGEIFLETCHLVRSREFEVED